MTPKPIARKPSRSDQPSSEEPSKARWDEVSVSTLVPKMRTDGLRAYFGQAEVLKGITLPIAEKQVTAVIGPSGCGKSTFVR
jgi:ABC-type bacteriocin/lantibiotic exporter with double-glycine peptidase domain